MVRERVFKTQHATPINGIICEPEKARRNAPAFLLFNSGLMHKVGTCRLSVKLARLLAQQGFYSVRFDFPGVGDSLQRRERKFHLVSSPEEIAEVIDAVSARFDANQFVLFGLCSGADAAFVAARSDSRVCGIVQIDPFVFRTGGWYTKHYLSRLFRLSSWMRFIRSIAKVQRSRNTNELPEFVEVADDAREMLSRDEVEKGYQILTDRDVAILVVLTGGQNYTINERTQFFKMFPAVDWRNNLTLHYRPDLEHIIPEPEGQRFVLDAITEWASTLYNTP